MLSALDQASRHWLTERNAFDCHSGFQSCKCDSRPYARGPNESVLVIKLNGDDLLIAEGSLYIVITLKPNFSDRFELEDCEEAKICSGLGMFHNRNPGSWNSVRKLMLKRFWNHLKCRLQSSVHPHERPNRKDQPEPQSVGNMLYRRVIGSLMYLIKLTRPDIYFAVG